MTFADLLPLATRQPVSGSRLNRTDSRVSLSESSHEDAALFMLSFSITTESGDPACAPTAVVIDGRAAPAASTSTRSPLVVLPPSSPSEAGSLFLAAGGRAAGFRRPICSNSRECTSPDFFLFPFNITSSFVGPLMRLLSSISDVTVSDESFSASSFCCFSLCSASVASCFSNTVKSVSRICSSFVNSSPCWTSSSSQRFSALSAASDASRYFAWYSARSSSKASRRFASQLISDSRKRTFSPSARLSSFRSSSFFSPASRTAFSFSVSSAAAAFSDRCSSLSLSASFLSASSNLRSFFRELASISSSSSRTRSSRIFFSAFTADRLLVITWISCFSRNGLSRILLPLGLVRATLRVGAESTSFSASFISSSTAMTSSSTSSGFLLLLEEVAAGAARGPVVVFCSTARCCSWARCRFANSAFLVNNSASK
mmetsp:Transcript_22559/g.57075  ORF Transcript_22559/g.57075 Transcript_22559/m.57075 type:complete len:430 (+) Transcript_22559:1643-2932(+)